MKPIGMNDRGSETDRKTVYRRKRQRRKMLPYLAVLPVCIYILLFLGSAFRTTLEQSFGIYPQGGLTDWTVRYFKEMFARKDFRDAFSFSLRTSAISAIAAVSVATAMALFFRSAKRRSEIRLYRIPVALPHAVIALSVLQIFGQSGFLARICHAFGMVETPGDFPLLLYDAGGIGMILSYMIKEIPFVYLTMRAVVQRLNHNYEDQAALLGADRFQCFLRITLPMILPNILYCLLLIFVYSFGAYELPMLLGPTYPKALALVSYQEYTNPVMQNRPYAMVINLVVIGIGLLATVLFFSAFRRLHTKTDSIYE